MEGLLTGILHQCHVPTSAPCAAPGVTQSSATGPTINPGSIPYITDLEYSIVDGSPTSSGRVASHPRISRARVVSGRRLTGSS